MYHTAVARTTAEVEQGMHSVSRVSPTLASVAFHTFLILGELGTVYTAFRGINSWTIFTGFLLWLAGLLTLVYPHVGTHLRYTRWVWGQQRRSAMPWLAMVSLFVVTLVRSSF
jgi:hypothetical protein